MTGRVQEKVAFITGAARGQGRAHALRLAEEGAKIIAVDLCGQIDSVPMELASKADLDETVALVEAVGGQIVAAIADVRDPESLRLAVDLGVEAFGGLDIVVANAGILSFGTLKTLADDAWRDVIDVNLTGVWQTCRATVPRMIETGRGGSIVMTSSAAGLRGVQNLPHYVAAKHGVVGLMRALAIELAPAHIRVNSIHPGTVDTAMVRNDATKRLYLGRKGGSDEAFAAASMGTHTMPVAFLEPVDIANAVLFLASDEARYVTGLTMSVDAGFVLK